MTLNDGGNCLGAYMSLMVYFDLYRLAVPLIPNYISHFNKYNVDLLQKILKETFELYISQFTKSVARNTTNSATSVARFFSSRAVQVDCKMNQLNLCLKYCFGICDIYRSKDMIDMNVVVIRNSSGKKVICIVIVTPGGYFLEGESLVNKLKALASYFDSPQRKEQL